MKIKNFLKQNIFNLIIISLFYFFALIPVYADTNLKIDLKNSAMVIAEQNVALLEGKVDRIIGMHAGKLKGEASASLSMGIKN